MWEALARVAKFVGGWLLCLVLPKRQSFDDMPFEQCQLPNRYKSDYDASYGVAPNVGTRYPIKYSDA